MSNDYIERDCLIDMISERNRNTCNGKMSCIQMKRMVESIPTADVSPVRHGTWIGKPISGFATVRCSVCMETFSENSGRWKFCPKCGARMLEDE